MNSYWNLPIGAWNMISTDTFCLIIFVIFAFQLIILQIFVLDLDIFSSNILVLTYFALKIFNDYMSYKYVSTEDVYRPRYLFMT